MITREEQLQLSLRYIQKLISLLGEDDVDSNKMMDRIERLLDGLPNPDDIKVREPDL